MEAPFHAALAALLQIASTQNHRLLLVGAFARTLCLPSSVRGPARKTRDADVAVRMMDWSAFDALLSACEPAFSIDRSELRLRHVLTGVRIDVVPCGAIEQPPGSLPLRRTTRVLNTTGLTEAFSTARSELIGGQSLLVPRPEAFVLLKLLSFLDRRAPRDLRDAGYVLARYPIDEAAAGRTRRSWPASLMRA
jgi:predicted nucleotidyltransferase